RPGRAVQRGGRGLQRAESQGQRGPAMGVAARLDAVPGLAAGARARGPERRAGPRARPACARADARKERAAPEGELLDQPVSVAGPAPPVIRGGGDAALRRARRWRRRLRAPGARAAPLSAPRGEPSLIHARAAPLSALRSRGPSALALHALCPSEPRLVRARAVDRWHLPARHAQVDG